MLPEIDHYRKYLDGLDIGDVQKAELITSLWSIMESFVDRAFGEHPAQLVLPPKDKFSIGPGNSVPLLRLCDRFRTLAEVRTATEGIKSKGE